MSNQLTIAAAANVKFLSGFDALSKSDKKAVQSISVQDVNDSFCDDWRNSFTPLVNNPKKRIVVLEYYKSGIMLSLRESNYGNSVPNWGLDSPSFALIRN